MHNPIPLPEHIDKEMFTLYRTLLRGEQILVFVDTAGEGSDNNAGQFLSSDSLDIPLVLSYKGSIVDVTPKLKTLLEWIYDVTGVPPVVAYETNNGGGYELERLSRLNKDQKYIIYYQYRLDPEGRLVRTDSMGWNTNSATRPVMLSGVQEVINNSLIIIYHRPTVSEMFSFVKKQKASGWRAEAETGAKDDQIMSLAGVWQLYQTEKKPSQYLPNYNKNKWRIS